jgi:hypothetical protein
MNAKKFVQMSKGALAARHNDESAKFPRLEPKNERGAKNMKYALLVYQSQESFERRDSAAMAAGRAYGEALQAAGIFVGGAGLESPQAATTVSVRDGKRQVHDGPYAETKEFLAGFGIIDVPDLDAALEWAARHPAIAYSSVEIRPLSGSHFSVGSKK